MQSAEENFFDVFTHNVIHGDLSTALSEPLSIAISERLSKTYFGDRNPIGEILESDLDDYQITAVFENIPENSHQQYDAIATFKGASAYRHWDDQNVTPDMLIAYSQVYTYFMTRADFTQAELSRALQEYFDRYAAETGRKFDVAMKFHPIPLADSHFESGWDYDRPTGNIFYVYGAIAVGLFLVLIACINYTNLATARATRRAKEVGMRRIMGAGRVQIGFQFVGESVVYAAVALVVASLLVYLAEAHTPLSQLLGKSQLINVVEQPLTIFYILLGALVIALLAGAYPALYLSSIAPLSTLGKAESGHRPRGTLRQTLVFIQFLVTVGVLSATLIMGMQLHYVANKPMGFDPANRLAITLWGADALEKLPVIENELLQDASVLGVAQTTYIPGRNPMVPYVQFENNAGQMEPITVNGINASHEFVDVLGIEIVEGRDFSEDLLTDVGASYLVNETLVKNKGWDDPIGKRVRWNTDGQVVGVMKDFHFSSLHQTVEPLLVIQRPPTDFAAIPPEDRAKQVLTIVIWIAPDNIPQILSHIESVVSQFDKRPFTYRFLDDLLDEIYQEDSNLLMLTALLGGICLLVSSLGLYGLAAFTTAQRTREIGIRKVLGASSNQIVLLLTRNLFLIVVVAARWVRLLRMLRCETG